MTTTRCIPLNGAYVSSFVPPPPAPTQRAYSAAGALTTNGATTTSSPTLSFASVPSWITPGMSVSDISNSNAIGTVQSTTATTVTLTANAAHAVSSGDQLSFGNVFVDALGDSSGDAAAIASSGFLILGTSGATSTRPLSPKAGWWHVDTTLGYAVVYDGAYWRNPVNGVAV